MLPEHCPREEQEGSLVTAARISEVAARYPAIAEVEVNPLVAHPGGAVALDVRMVLQSEAHTRAVGGEPGEMVPAQPEVRRSCGTAIVPAPEAAPGHGRVLRLDDAPTPIDIQDLPRDEAGVR
jgi:hypothetical protein